MAKVTDILILLLLSTAFAKPQKKEMLDIIKKINSIQSTWTAGYTEFSALSYADKKQLLGAFPLDENTKRKSVDTASSIPPSFDARTQWPYCSTIPTIKDQGRCGSCWAVSTASAASDRLCIATNYRSSLNLSAENLMTCCKQCVTPFGGCNGGFVYEAWSYLVSTGIVTGGDFNSDEVDNKAPLQNVSTVVRVKPNKPPNMHRPPHKIPIYVLTKRQLFKVNNKRI